MTIATREQPNDQAAEQAVLGAMLLHPDAIATATNTLTPASFYRPNHAAIYQAITSLYAKGEPADPITVANHLRQTQQLDAIGGPATLTDLIGAAPSLTSTDHYARIVEDHYLARQLIGIGSEIVELGRQPEGDIATTIDRAEQLMFGLSDNEQRTSQALNLGDTLTDWLDRAYNAYTDGRPPGVATPFPDLDAIILGLQPGQLIVAAGRPGMGKTSFGLDLATHAAREGHPTMIVSLEMSLEELQNRVIAATASVALEHLRTLNIVERDWPRINMAFAELRDIPLEIVDDARANLINIRSQARRVASRYGRLGLIVVDYVQLVEALGRHSNREGEVAEIARGLKKLARELHVPVVALAQLNRSLEGRADKRPMLSDLRESGEIENAADVVMFLYRDEYYRPDSPDRGVAEVIVAKQRNGPTRSCRLAWLEQYTRFASMARV